MNSKFLSCVTLVVSISLNGSAQKPLDPFQQELKERLNRRMATMQKKLEQMPQPKITKPTEPAVPKIPLKPVTKPVTSQAEQKEQEAKDREKLKDAFWGLAQNAKKVWDEVQALLKQHQNVSWEGWKQKEYDRIGILRDTESYNINSAFAEFLTLYINQVYGELSSQEKNLLLKSLDVIASALFGNASLPSENKALVQDIIKDIKKISPKTAPIIGVMEKILQARATSPAAPKPVQPKPSVPASVTAPSQADVKKQSAEKCLEELRKFYRDELEKERKGLMDIFTEITGMTEQQFKNVVDSAIINYPVDIHDHKLPENSTYYQRITSILIQSGLGNKNIKLYENSALNSPAAANPISIIINIPLIARYSTEIFDALIRHEVQHILFQDGIIEGVLAEILKNNPYKENYMQMWFFFVEKRADIMSWLESVETVEAAIIFWSTLPMKFEGDVQHISPANREAMAREILKRRNSSSSKNIFALASLIQVMLLKEIR